MYLFRVENTEGLSDHNNTISKFLIALFLIAIIFFGLFFRKQNLALKIVFLDVGQGDSILVSDGNAQLLVDAGKDESSLKQLSKFISPMDRTIEYAIATHPDSDHIGGFWYILQYYHIEHLIISDAIHETDISQSILQKAKQEGTKIIIAKTGNTFSVGNFWNGVVLWPDGILSQNFDDTNDHSIVIRIDSKQELFYRKNFFTKKVMTPLSSFLLTGDASIVVENILERNISQKILDTDVLKLGHHGSKTSSLFSFLETNSPLVSIISAGCNNSYDHPHDEVLERLKELHILFLETCKRGNIVFGT